MYNMNICRHHRENLCSFHVGVNISVLFCLFFLEKCLIFDPAREKAKKLRHLSFSFSRDLFFFVAQQVFWHSSAHILGEALERVYGGCLCYGPPVECGFYYDMHLDDKQVKWIVLKIVFDDDMSTLNSRICFYLNWQVSNHDFPVIENVVKSILKDKQPFERLEVKKETLLEMFKVSVLLQLNLSPANKRWKIIYRFIIFVV